MTVCHIINPPLTQITNQCLSRHHLLPNINSNPNLSFSLSFSPTSDHHCTRAGSVAPPSLLSTTTPNGTLLHLLCASFFLHHHVAGKVHDFTIFAPRRNTSFTSRHRQKRSPHYCRQSSRLYQPPLELTSESIVAPSSRTSCCRTFFFTTMFMAAPCSNAKSPHSILQWQHHRGLPQTQQHLLHQLCSHRYNHHNNHRGIHRTRTQVLSHN